MEVVGDSMIPILFASNATSFSTNGIGRLADAISCQVTEERNGVYELVLVYPTTGVHYDELEVSKIIVVKPNQSQERQAFEIYSISKPINQRVTVNANHISYRQSYVPIEPFIATGITATMQGLVDNSLESNIFTFTTDLTNEVSTFNLSTPASMRKCLGGMQGSVLDVFSGSTGVEYLWDNFNTFITLSRGADNGVYLRYRKNITDIEEKKSIEDTITGVLPVWNNQDNTISIHGAIQYSQYASNYPIHRTEILDLSAEYETMPTSVELETAGQNYISRAGVGLPNTNIKISFVDLTGIERFENIGALETVNLCDTIHVIYEPLGIQFDAKVVKTTWDVLRNRYTEIEIGNPKNTISKTIADNIGDISSLNLSNNKLVSVTQTLDREMGVVQTTVASVEERADAIDTSISTLSISLEGIQSQVTQTQADLSGSVSQLSTAIQQTASDITLTIQDVQSTISDQGTQIATLETYIRATTRGLEIGRNTDTITAVLEPTQLAFYNNSDKKLAWLSTDDGLGASGLSIGDANVPANRWRVFTWDSGKHLSFTRHN